MAENTQTAESFKALYETIIRLRAPDGCPWDREQTPLSLRGDLIEETYECIEAIDEQDPAHIREELGDLFLLVAMLAYMHEQEKIFSVADTLDGITEKLIRRHPHVFKDRDDSPAEKDTPPLSSSQVLRNWAKIKVEQEGRRPADSLLDEVSRGLPPLDRAGKLQKKAAAAGFDWTDTAGVIGKIREELCETENAISSGDGTETEEELGDLLFSVVNLCRFLKIDPSVALQKTNVKFTERFKFVESRMKESGMEMNAQNFITMDQYWNEAKKQLS